MQQTSSQNVRIFHQPPAPGSPEERLERAVREIFGGMRGRDGRALDYNVRRGRVNPLRVTVAKLAKAKRKGVPRSQVLKLVTSLHEYVDERFPEPARYVAGVRAPMGGR